MISRDELAAWCLVSLMTPTSRDTGPFDGWDFAMLARASVKASDALLSALAPKHDEAPPAPTVAPLTEEEREELADAMHTALEEWVVSDEDKREIYLVYADTAAAWFAKRGAK